MSRLLIASIDTLPRLGGISVATHHLANALSDLGEEVHVLGPADSNVPAPFKAAYYQHEDQLAEPALREGPVWQEQQLPGLRSRLGQFWKKHDFDRALIMHPFYFGPALVELGQELNKPVSVMFHGYELRSQQMWPARCRAMRMRGRAHGPSLSDVTYALARSADEVLVNSRYTAGLVRKTGRKGPIRIIGCGLELKQARREIMLEKDLAAQVRGEVREGLNLGQDTFLIGTLGRLVASKNIGDLIRVLDYLPEAKALIIGDGPEYQHLLGLAKQTGLADRVIFRTDIDENEKWRLMRAMDVFCLLSRPLKQGEVEGFGIVLLEASAAGIPVIANRSGGMTDVVNDHVTGLTVRHGRLKELARAILKIKEDKPQADRMVASAQDAILERFNWSHIAMALTASWRDTDPSEAVPLS